MLLLVFAFILLLAYISPKSKFVILLEILLMIFMFSFIKYEGDWQTYKDIYLGYASSTYMWHFEPAFSILMMICAKSGVSYVWFRFIVCFIYCIVMLVFVQSQTEYYALATGLMLFFPFFVFVTTIRSGIACPLILCAFSILATDKPLAKKKFVVLVLIATLFHYSCIAFLPFVITKQKISDTKKIVFFVIAAFAAVVLNFTTVIPEILSVVTLREKTLTWFSHNDGTANLTGAAFESILLVANLLISKKSRQICERNSSELKPYQVRFSEMTEEASKLLLYFLPLMWLSSPFMRLSYMTFPMIIISTINAVSTLEKEKVERGLAALVVILGISLRFYNDLPYLKSGMIFFGEFLNNNYVFY